MGKASIKLSKFIQHRLGRGRAPKALPSGESPPHTKETHSTPCPALVRKGIWLLGENHPECTARAG